jgi:hypothetical protein
MRIGKDTFDVDIDTVLRDIGGGGGGALMAGWVSAGAIASASADQPISLLRQ